MNISVRDTVIAMGSALTTFCAAVVFLFANFETVDAASQKWAEHNQAIICETVSDLAAEKRSLETRLKFDTNLTPEQRTFLKEQLRDVKNQIAKKDPDGIC